MMAVPLRHGDRAVGFLYLDSRTPEISYGRQALVLLSLLMRPCARLAEVKGFLPSPP